MQGFSSKYILSLSENNADLQLSDSSERQVSLYEICQSQLKERKPLLQKHSVLECVT
jgi:hypothetical protein